MMPSTDTTIAVIYLNLCTYMLIYDSMTISTKGLQHVVVT